MKRFHKISLTLILIFTIAFCSLFSLRSPFQSGDKNLKGIQFSFFEDTSGQLNVNQINHVFLQNEFIQKSSPDFNFGRSRSAFWVGITAKNTLELKKYIAVYCPNIQDIQLYMPTGSGYQMYASGWGNCAVREDEGLTYPAFRITPDFDQTQAIFIRAQSVYSLVYHIGFYSEDELTKNRTIDACLNSFLFGMLLAIVMINLIIYLKLKSKICLIFSLCIFLIVLHQGCTTGIYNILFPNHSDRIMKLSIEIGLLYLVSLILFFLIFSEVKRYRIAYYRCLEGLIVLCLLGYPMCFFDKVAANLYAHLLSAVIPLTILYISLRLSLSKQLQHRLFFIGWNITTITYILVTLCTEGIFHLKNNFITIHATLIGIAFISILFTVAIVNYIKNMQMQHLKMEHKIQMASEQVKRTETALMQTQIKPHFLFNTLTAIEQLCAVDSQKAQTAIADFASYLRSNVDFSTETKLIRIEKELENVKHYLSLEKMRFEERLTVAYEIKATQFMLPPLVVQPIVENAVRHGVTKKPEGGTVKVAVGETPLAYVITVSDNGIGFHPESDKQNEPYHIGIRNARDRLTRQCNGTLEVKSQIGVGTTVIITLPKASEWNPDHLKP